METSKRKSMIANVYWCRRKLFATCCLSIILLISAGFHAGAQGTNFPVRNGISFSPRWLDNLLFLNNFDMPLPIEKQIMYKWAETGLACQACRSFSYLTDYSEFQSHCRRYNILHTGGPILGNISGNSVDI